MAERLAREVQILSKYENEVNSMIEQFIESNPNKTQYLQAELDQHLQMYRQQIDFVQGQFPDADEGQRHKASYLTAKAKAKLASAKLKAKQYEDDATAEAIGLIYEAIRLWDHAGPRLLKAQILYESLDQKENALQELNYIIAKFQEDKDHNKARQLKAAIENSL